MSYVYTDMRDKLFTEYGQVRFIKIRDKVLNALKTHGAFRLLELGITDWEDVAVIDRMVELKELIEFRRECWGQYRVFTSPQTNNY